MPAPGPGVPSSGSSRYATCWKYPSHGTGLTSIRSSHLTLRAPM